MELVSDFLPAHYGLEDWETITSYLTRLMIDNPIDCVLFFSRIVYGYKAPNRMYRFQDFPPVSWGKLSTLTTQSEMQLLGGTFYWLIKKFRAFQSWGKKYQRFLTNSIASNLRFCPLCLQENNYYRLYWRFNIISGCSNHNVYLLDSCPSCKSKLRIYPTIRIIGKCYNCGYDLRSSKNIILPENDAIYNKSKTEDIKFLLKPHHPDEFLLNGISDIGARIFYFRKQYGLSVLDVANKIGLTSSSVNILERNDWQYIPGTFENMQKFVDLIGVDFQTFFSHDIDKFLEPKIKYRICDTKNEDQPSFNKDKALYEQLIRSYSTLTQNHQEVTQDELCEFVGFSKRTIRKYPISRRFLADIAKQEKISKRQKSHEILEKEIYSVVEKAILDLLPISQTPSLKQIAEKSGYTSHYLRMLPSVYNLVEPYVKKTRRTYLDKEKTEKNVMSKFYNALEKLKSQGTLPDISSIAELCELSESYLRRFLEIRLYLANLASNKAEIIENDLYKRMKQTYEELIASGTYTGIINLCERLSISITTLERYSKTRNFIKLIGEG